jgi:hypothetical protein
MFGAHRSWGGWDVMLHGTLFVQWLYEPHEIHRTGGFSTHQLGSVNWACSWRAARSARGALDFAPC